MESENLEFIRELQNVPGLPDDLYAGIHKRIRKGILIRRILVTMTFVCMAGIGTLIIMQQKANHISPEIASELQIIHEYLNGEDVDSEFGVYAVADLQY